MPVPTQLSVVILGCLLSSAAAAVGTYGEAIPKSASSVRFDRLDRDGDGYLDRDELAQRPALRAALPRLDSNGDGKLDDSEFSALETDDGAPKAD